MHLVLASASPRRAELLRAAGFTFEVCAADVDERVRPGEPPREYVRRLAMEKSAAALGTNAGSGDVLVIGADTAVIVDDTILGKPVDDADAARMLQRLRGRSHVVMTGVSVRATTGQLDAVEETRVVLGPITGVDVEWYVASGEGRDKAGAYAIQGLASRFIPRIEGSYSNVVGLPVATVARLIGEMHTRMGILASGR
jgi:septum formation protein